MRLISVDNISSGHSEGFAKIVQKNVLVLLWVIPYMSFKGLRNINMSLVEH